MRSTDIRPIVKEWKMLTTYINITWAGCIFILFSFGTSVLNEATKVHSLRVSNSLLLPCDRNDGSANQWKHFSRLIYFHSYFNDDNFEQSALVFENFSLLIMSGSLYHTGLYECLNESVILSSHYVKIEVPPTLSLSWNGSTIVNKTYKGNETDFREEHEKYVEEGEEIVLVCLADGAKPQANLTWMINGITQYGVNSEAVRNSKENRTWDSNSTLVFNATEETISVICNSTLQESDVETWIGATFFTYVRPNISFEVDGVAISDTFYVTEGESINITCHSIGGRPLGKLSWDTNNIHHKLERILEDIYPLWNETRPITSTVKFTTSQESEIIKCQSILVQANVSTEANLTVSTCAVPEVSLTVNDDNTSSEVYINKSESVIIICNASGARPRAKLEIIKNGKPMHKAVSTSTPRKSVIDSSMILTYLSTSNDTIECVSFVPNCNITTSVNVTIFVNNNSEENDSDEHFNNHTVWPIAASVITFVILLVYCFYNAFKRFKSTNRANLAGNFSMPMSEYTHTLGNTLPKLPKDFVEDGFNTNPKPPTKELPKIPSGSEISHYDDLSDHENTYEIQFHNTSEYYSTMSNSGGTGRMFYEDDLCFILNMNMGNIYNRWMGTIAISKEATKCVVLTTLTDNILRQSQIQWDKFVKRALELPKNSHLAKIEGIGIDKGKLYLIQDHLACETLDVRISIPIFPTEVMRYLLGILEGLEVIQSFGFLHPGLSTKKVLLTKQGICKLYDFCLSEDASNTVKIKKSLMICSYNQFAPESLSRNEYDQSSDVWSAAVVIWEIMSKGSPPFNQEEESAPVDGVAIKMPQAWPTKFRGLRNKRLYECWNKDSSLRLTINQLRTSFKEMFDSLNTYGEAETIEDDDTDSYVPMTGNSGDGKIDSGL